VVELEAYAADCRLYGLIDLGDRRLTDVLNATHELPVTDARLESLADGHVVEMPELTVDGAELCAVVAAGSRGDASRRLRTHATRVHVDVGPYRIEGSVHGTPAADPVALALRRAAWLPLTDCTVAYRRGSETVKEDVEILLVNRDLATSLRPVEETSALLPWETAREKPAMTSRSVDLTHSLQDEPAREDDLSPQPKATDPTV
jgi:hypothetical protein